MLFTVVRDTWDVERAEGIRLLLQELLMLLVDKQCVDASKDITVRRTLTTEIVLYVHQESTQIL